MLFNSLTFIIFLFLVFVSYWAVPSSRLQLRNLILLVASYVFYGWWDWRFLSLIFLSSMIDFWASLMISAARTSHRKKIWMTLSLITNLGCLGYFKYANFFIDSFVTTVQSMGISADPVTLNIILPVGISFYTFQTLSYTIDVYRGQSKPTNNLLAFLTFVSFFPQLVAGPIERAANLLPQFLAPKIFDAKEAQDGVRRMLWGFFKKIVIADSLSGTCESIFKNYAVLDGGVLVTGVVFFAIQIYCDFSGYSDIAIGTAKLFGVRLMDNFRTPYFSRSPGEFWQRWHISLSTWFRDYVYIPLGGKRGSYLIHMRNILITFSLSGLWHGANWTYVIWGVLNGLYVVAWRMAARESASSSSTPHASFRDIPVIVATFCLINLSWVFFRSPDVATAFHYLQRMASPWKTLVPYPTELAWVLVLCCIEWIQRKKTHPLDLVHWPVPLRWLAYYGVALAIIFFGNMRHETFIYFQF